MALITLVTEDVVFERAMSILRDNDANPDVGFGLSPRRAVQEAMKFYGLDAGEFEFEATVERVVQVRRRRY